MLNIHFIEVIFYPIHSDIQIIYIGIIYCHDAINCMYIFFVVTCNFMYLVAEVTDSC